MDNAQKLESLSVQQDKLCEQLLKIKDQFGILSEQVEPNDIWLSALPIENIHELHKPIHRLSMMRNKSALRKTGLDMLQELTKLEESIRAVKLDILIDQIKCAAGLTS
jgi:hypothetical protein